MQFDVPPSSVDITHRYMGIWELVCSNVFAEIRVLYMNEHCVRFVQVLCVPQRSGESSITGWVSAFTCFDKEGNFLGKNKKFTTPGDFFYSREKEGEFPMIRDSQICHNVVSCPVKIDDNGKEYDGTLFSGQTVCEAKRAGGTGHPTVRPRNDWCLAVAVK